MMPFRLRNRGGWILASVVLTLAAVSGCSEPDLLLPGLARPSLRGRRVRARVLSVRTNMSGKPHGFRHLIIYANNRVRIGNEVDSWRLFDLAARTVTTVDNPTRTYRTESLSSVVRKHRQLLATPIPDLIKPAEVEILSEPARWNNISIRRYRIRSGGYRRELWMSIEPILPEPFWVMYLATEPLAGPYSGILQKANGLLLQSNGFPVVDRSDMEYDGKAMVIEKVLEKVEDRAVPASWLEVPAGYKNLTPVTKPGAGRQPASSRPSGRNTPREGSPPSSKDQKTP